MKNLLERMKAEPLAKLNEEKDKYVGTFQSVERDLKDNEFVADLTFRTIAELRIHGLVNEITFTTIRELFND
jgi:hypothetical protein